MGDRAHHFHHMADRVAVLRTVDALVPCFGCSGKALPAAMLHPTDDYDNPAMCHLDKGAGALPVDTAAAEPAVRRGADSSALAGSALSDDTAIEWILLVDSASRSLADSAQKQFPALQDFADFQISVPDPQKEPFLLRRIPDGSPSPSCVG